MERTASFMPPPALPLGKSSRRILSRNYVSPCHGLDVLKQHTKHILHMQEFEPRIFGHPARSTVYRLLCFRYEVYKPSLHFHQKKRARVPHTFTRKWFQSESGSTKWQTEFFALMSSLEKMLGNNAFRSGHVCPSD
jgi:hypothetical protein